MSLKVVDLTSTEPPSFFPRIMGLEYFVDRTAAVKVTLLIIRYDPPFTRKRGAEPPRSPRHALYAYVWWIIILEKDAFACVRLNQLLFPPVYVGMIITVDTPVLVTVRFPPSTVCAAVL
jgi:hypothetical protein